MIWLDELAQAIITEVPKSLYLLTPAADPDDAPIRVPIKVLHRLPDAPFAEGEFPCLTFFNYDVVYDGVRAVDRDTVIVSKDIENLTGIAEKPAIPYRLFYQLELHAKYHGDISVLLQQWFETFAGKVCYLPVTDPYDSTSHLVTMKQCDRMRIMDTTSGPNKHLRRIFSYAFDTEIDSHVQTEVALIGEVEIVSKLIK